MQWATVIVRSLILSLLSTYFANSSSIRPNYPSLIVNAHKYLSTSSIFVVHSEQEGMDDLDQIEALLYQLSEQRIFGVTVAFGRLNETMRFYSNRVGRVLIVVSLQNWKVVAEFSNLTGHFEMSSSCWFLIFNDKVYLANYLPQSDRNMFNLRFDTQMLVARTGRYTIQEWYWLQNRVKMEDLAVWDFDSRFIPRTTGSLYQRRSNLENSVILATTVNNPPIVTFANNKSGGFCGAILAELRRVANFSVKFVPPRESSYGSWNVEENRWTGMIEVLVTGGADIAVAEFTMSTSRSKAVDFSHPLFSTYEKLYIKRPESRIRWSAYWQTFSPGIWTIVQLLIFFSTILLTLITTARRSRITLHVFSGYFLLVFGIYCQQALPEFPTDLPSRITYFSIFLSAVIVSAAYSAALISFLTVTSADVPFTNSQEFVDDGTYRLIVFRDGAEYDMFQSSTEPLKIKMRSMMNDRNTLPTTIREAFTQVCTQRVALYIPAALEEAFRLMLPCKVIGLETKRSRSLAMTLSKRNPYNGLLNYHLQRFRDLGILDRLKREYNMVTIPPKSSHNTMTVWGVMPLLAILAGGVILAILILFLERFLFIRQSRGSIKEKNRQSKTRSKNYRYTSNIHPRQRSSYLTPWHTQILPPENTPASKVCKDNSLKSSYKKFWT